MRLTKWNSFSVLSGVSIANMGIVVLMCIFGKMYSRRLEIEQKMSFNQDYIIYSVNKFNPNVA